LEKQFHILQKINSPAEVKKLTLDELELLVKEIRGFIIEVLSNNPGHFGASMGVVELTVALHYLVETPTNDLIWDVGHQAYAHKILTERKADFANIRKFDHLSGFPKRKESIYDAFGTGHSSTSISAALGMALANQLDGHNQCSIAIIGDGALTGGMAFEALNHLGTTQANVLVILNDNDNSIDDNVGALQHHLNSINSSHNFFTQLNLPYSGPIDGHNLPLLLSELKNTLAQTGPRVLHIKTQKGKGYEHAEKGNTTHWHAPGKFNIKTGESNILPQQLPITYQQIVGDTLIQLAEKNDKIIVVTPAMASGSNLVPFKSRFPNRFIDVGIAEQHAVTLSAGLATKGKKVFCVVYSTFLQRGYDQLIHDVALQNLPVIFLIDRAGLVGNDGATHHGAFDLAFLNCIPNMLLLVPRHEAQLAEMMHFAAQYTEGPIAIRYPRGKGMLTERAVITSKSNQFNGLELIKGKKVALLNIGALFHTVEKAVKELNNQGFEIGFFDLQCAKPLNESFLTSVFDNYQTVITVEDSVITGGIGSAILQWKSNKEYAENTFNWGLPDQFIEHGSQEELYASVGLNVEQLMERIKFFMKSI
jgi:1-deoxy-D-xylulose-5-phosphate synthase